MTRYAYFEGEFVPVDQAKVSVMTNSFNYGGGCFGGLRAYWNEQHQQLYGFRWLDHYKRFLNSAKLLHCRLDHSPESLSRITVELLEMEGWQENCYIRPLAYKANTDTIAVRLHDMVDEVTIFSRPQGKYIQNDRGAHVCVSAWRRVDDTAIPARGKIIGSYVNSALIKSDALLSGYDEAVVLNQDGHVAEGSAANFMMVRDGVLITSPITSNVLEGITRQTVLQIARDELGIDVMERQIDRSELYVADEAFFCGTGVQIVAISAIDNRAIGDGTMGPLTSQIRDHYFDIVYGRNEKYMDWLTPVHQLELV